ncbi:Crp/Fnr family transcriptional regulator [Tenacibaculum sp. M341]|nr:Crp/Fnr family transcriptional regulator [Tenacibaculum sp. M341]
MTDINKITALFNGVELSNVEEGLILQKFQEITVQKNDLLVRHNETIQYQYYVVKGCLRTYFIDESGKEHTIQFAIEDWWISDYIAYFGNRKTVFNIECIKEALLLRIKKDDLEEIYNKVPQIERFFRKKIEKAFVRQELRILGNLTQTAKERYLLFLETYPLIEKNIKNYHIASYLGITTESLSRIRKEIAVN